jgi:hypothetical protein
LKKFQIVQAEEVEVPVVLKDVLDEEIKIENSRVTALKIGLKRSSTDEFFEDRDTLAKKVRL